MLLFMRPWLNFLITLSCNAEKKTEACIHIFIFIYKVL